MSGSPVPTNAERLDAAAVSQRDLSIEALDGARARAYAVDGRAPGLVARPRSVEAVSEAMAAAAMDTLSVSPLGGITRASIGNQASSFDLAIDMTGVDRILAHDASDLTATVEAGVRVARLQAALAQHGQYLAIDPPLPDRATIGGSLAVGWSGPLTLQSWSPRDLVIGMKVVQADGTTTKSGGQVVKNVSGYDMARMHVGALGTLGVIAEVSFKLSPLPRRRSTVLASFDSTEDCLGGASKVFKSNLVPLAITTLHGRAAQALALQNAASKPLLAVLVAGRAKSVRRQVDDVIALCRSSNASKIETIDDSDAAILWRRISDWGWDPQSRPFASIRVSVLPTQIADVLRPVSETSNTLDIEQSALTHTTQGTVQAQWYIEDDAAAAGRVCQAITQAMSAAKAVGGTTVVEQASVWTKDRVNVWGDPLPGLSIMRNLKRQYDPNGLLNPGRFAGGI